MMKIFRQKYLYNPANPIYSSNNVRTYNCMNTQTKNKRLIIIEHLNEPSIIQDSPGILQPIESPTLAEPFSIYPLVRCVSEIQRIAEPQVMYVVKCIQECKIQKPIYTIICDQGICCSEVEGLLPNKSPTLLDLVSGLLGLPKSLDFDKSLLSKQGFLVYKGILNGENVISKLQSYGWKDAKKQKQPVTDPDFIIFKGRRKEEGIFGDQYGLAWKNEYGLCKVKHISLGRDGFEEHFMKQYRETLQYFQKVKNQKQGLFLKHLKFAKDQKSIKIFTELANQGSLLEFITNKYQQNQPLTQGNTIDILSRFSQSMSSFSHTFQLRGLGTLHIRNIYIHNNRICIGEPLFITDTNQKKLRQSKNVYDYYSPQMKNTIVLYENFERLSKQKMDIWFFGMLLHKIYTRQIPIFNASKKPVLNKEKISPSMNSFITKCLDQTPENRPSWVEVNLKQLDARHIKIEEFNEQVKEQRQSIRLGPRSERMSQLKSPVKQQRMVEQLQSQKSPSLKPKTFMVDQESLNIQTQQSVSQKQIQYNPITAQQVTSNLKNPKLIIKTIIILAMYIFIFFRPFLWSSVSIINVRSNYATTSLHLMDSSNNRVSSAVILSSNPTYFLDNSVSFDQVQNSYQCIDDNFDPVNNPTFSLLSYVQSGGFLALLLTGWLTALILCVVKGISIWKGGISNLPKTGIQKYLVVYGFHELTFAALLFAHFFIYEFFYFAGATPCLSIANFKGLEPFFDSSLYLFLRNNEMYFRQIFASLGLLSIILLLSNCFYALGPKLDQRYFTSCFSIIFRFVPFFLLLLICRIGVFGVFSPTAINDRTSIIPTMMTNSFQGFLGIVPQIFIIFCLTVEVLFQVFWNWLEKKTKDSECLIRLFAIKREKKNEDGQISRLNENFAFEQSNEKLHILNLDQ